MLVDGDELTTAAPLECASPIVFVEQEVLQRAEQKCAEAAFVLICTTQRTVYEQMGEEALDKILRFGRGVAAASHKGIKRWPIRFAEVGKRFFCCRCIGLLGAGNQSPVSRLKRSSAFLQCSWNWFHELQTPFASRGTCISNANGVLSGRSTEKKN